MERKRPKNVVEVPYQFRNSVAVPSSYTSPRYRNRFGFQEAIRSVTFPALVAPSAPSPVAANTKAWPVGGVVPFRGVNVLVLTGGWTMPLLKFNVIEARWE